MPDAQCRMMVVVQVVFHSLEQILPIDKCLSMPLVDSSLLQVGCTSLSSDRHGPSNSNLREKNIVYRDKVIEPRYGVSASLRAGLHAVQAMPLLS